MQEAEGRVGGWVKCKEDRAEGRAMDQAEVGYWSGIQEGRRAICSTLAKKVVPH